MKDIHIFFQFGNKYFPFRYSFNGRKAQFLRDCKFIYILMTHK